MTLLKSIPVDALKKSPLNERLEEDDQDDEQFQELVGSIEAVGDVNDPPLVRPDSQEGGYEVIKGSRRLEAAKEADGVTTIRCEVDDVDDGEALLRTITDNIGSFKKDITARERALSLYRLWEEEGDTINPSVNGLADLLGVSSSAVSDWLEPLSEEWEDTIINPLSAEQHNSTVRNSVRQLSTRKLRSIRKATGGGEKGIELAEQTVEHGLTIQDLARVRQHIEAGASIESAVGVVIGELSLADIEAELDEPTTEQAESEPEPEPEVASASVATAAESGATDDGGQTSSWTQPNAVAGDGGATAAQNDAVSSPSAENTSSPASPSTTADTATDADSSSSPSSSFNPDLAERYQGRDLVASPDEIDAASETRGWSDTLDELDAEAADGDDEAAELEVCFTLRGSKVAAAQAAIDHHAAEDAADLGELALTRFLKEGKWLA